VPRGLERGAEHLHVQRLAEPDHVGAEQLAAGFAARQRVHGGRVDVRAPRAPPSAAGAAIPVHRAVHLERMGTDVVGPRVGQVVRHLVGRAVMEPVDILRDERHVVVREGEAGERQMRGVRQARTDHAPAPCVPLPDRPWIARERLRRRELLGPPRLPETVRATERRHAGLGGYAGAGEHDDPLGAADEIPSERDRRAHPWRAVQASSAHPTRKATPPRGVIATSHLGPAKTNR